MSCPTPDGAFYVFVNVEPLLGRGPLATDVDVCSYLLEKAHCALVPGSAFGAPGHFRMSYACSEAQIDDGLGRIPRALASPA